MGDGLEAMEELEAEIVKKQARQIQAKAFAVAVIATAVTWFVA